MNDEDRIIRQLSALNESAIRVEERLQKIHFWTRLFVILSLPILAAILFRLVWIMIR